MRTRFQTTIIAAVACAVLWSTSGSAWQPHIAACSSRDSATLTDLKSVNEVRTLFNQDAGKVRLLLLLSPT